MTINAPKKILIVDDLPIVRDGMKAALAQRPEWIICGETGRIEEATRLISDRSPNLVVLDLHLDDGDGMDLIRHIATLANPPLVLVCTRRDERLHALKAVAAGARGFVSKTNASDTLVKAIETVLDGKLYLSDESTQRLLRGGFAGAPIDPLERLTQREFAVLRGMGRGMTVAQVAVELSLSEKTVETYRDRARKKLNLQNAADFAWLAVKWVTENEQD